MADPISSIAYDPATNRVTVTQSFDGDANANKPGLAKTVREHHWLGQASRLAMLAGEYALHGAEKVEARYAEEIAAKAAEIDARKKGFGTLASDAQATPKAAPVDDLDPIIA